MNEREDKIIGKNEVKTIYKEDNSKITYFVIEGFGDVFMKGSNYAYNNKYSIKIYLNVTQ